MGSFRGIHYKGVEILDFSYECDEYKEVFLDYLAIFTSSFIVQTKTSNIENVSFFRLVEKTLFLYKENKLYYNSSFNDKDLKSLFDTVYELDWENKVIHDSIQENNTNKQCLFSEKLKELDTQFINNNINIPVCSLLKYLEHRSCIESDIFEKGFNYGFKNLLQFQNKDDTKYYTIDISNFIKFSEDLTEFNNVLKYILLVTKLLKHLIEKNIQLLSMSKEGQYEFTQKLIKFSEDLAPLDLKEIESKRAFSGFRRYNLKSIAQNVRGYIQEKSVVQTNSQIKSELDSFLLNNIPIITFQLEKATQILDQIKIKNYKHAGLSKIKFSAYTLIFNLLRKSIIYFSFFLNI